MLAAGINMYTVLNQLTHTSIKTTQIYGHLVDDDKKKVSEIISLDFLMMNNICSYMSITLITF